MTLLSNVVTNLIYIPRNSDFRGFIGQGFPTKNGLFWKTSGDIMGKRDDSILPIGVRELLFRCNLVLLMCNTQLVLENDRGI